MESSKIWLDFMGDIFDGKRLEKTFDPRYDAFLSFE